MKIITIKFQFSAVLAIRMPYIVSIVIAIATTVIRFPAVLGTGVWALGCRHLIMSTGFWVLAFEHGIVGYPNYMILFLPTCAYI